MHAVLKRRDKEKKKHIKRYKQKIQTNAPLQFDYFIRFILNELILYS